LYQIGGKMSLLEETQVSVRPAGKLPDFLAGDGEMATLMRAKP
jgi:hypothetical protein